MPIRQALRVCFFFSDFRAIVSLVLDKIVRVELCPKYEDISIQIINTNYNTVGDTGGIRYRRWFLFFSRAPLPPKNKQIIQERHLKIPFLGRQIVILANFRSHIVESQFFISLWNRYNPWLSDDELIQISVFPAPYIRINPCFTAGKWIEVWDCHATHCVES